MAVRLTTQQVQSLTQQNLSRARWGHEVDGAAVEIARRTQDPVLLAEALVPHVVHAIFEAEMTTAAAVMNELDSIADLKIESLRLRFQWAFHYHRGLIALQSLQYEPAEHSIAASVAVAEKANKPGWSKFSQLTLGRCQYRRGRLSEAITTLTELSNQPEVSEQFLLLSRAHLAEMFRYNGSEDQALKLIAQFLSHGESFGPAERGYFGATYAHMLSSMNREEEAAQAIADARVESAMSGTTFTQAVVDTAEARSLLNRGNFDQALDLAGRACGDFARTGNLYEELRAAVMVARCKRLLGDTRGAVALLGDRRNLKMGPRFQSDVAREQAKCSQIVGDWRQVVAYQNRILELDASLDRRLPDLFDLLTQDRRGADAKQQRQQLAQANQTLQTAQQEKDELLAIIAHDLRSPLAALRLTLEHLQRNPGLPGKSRRLETARLTVGRVSWLTQRLERLQEVEQDELSPVIADVDVVDILRSVRQQYELMALSKQISVDCAGPEAAWAQTDGDLVSQIVDNLVSNALKYTQRGGRVVLSVAVLESAAVRLTVADDGLGLSEADMAGLFLKYSRLISRPTGSEPSLGIGLYIARHIAQTLGTDVTAKSAGPGLGSTFSISLPQKWEANAKR